MDTGLVRLKKGEVSREDLRRISEMLGKTFVDYPLGVYVYPEAAVREEKVGELFTMMFRYALKFGEVWVTSMNFEGMVLWLPPRSPHMRNSRILRSGVVRLARTSGVRSSIRLIHFSGKLERIHHRQAPFPHWYGLGIGVRPDCQRRGLAKKMLLSKMEEADRDGLPIYFETQSETNVAIYQTFGFQVVEEFSIKGSGITSWTMVRRQKGICDGGA